ncbi:hypothetical protein B0I35DRAFT_477903 [Stachybotrys elegans]|uniref:Uncharacterized protein n=1 Tax=Stachybotrys elegans TaxID=80388 RepID=A0A8K0SZ40_9HYPO|nr:hypothetical protein B0I35DRAFT_477903 [Stachybotrys elegans]
MSVTAPSYLDLADTEPKSRREQTDSRRLLDILGLDVQHLPEIHEEQFKGDLESILAFKSQISIPITKKTSPRPDFGNEYFEIYPSKIAGWGVRAVKPLYQGQDILREAPLLIANIETLFDEFYRLDPESRRIALSLHANVHLKPGTPPIQAVWATNW